MSALDNNDWTEEERALLARLPETTDVERTSEERLITALRRRGIFGAQRRRWPLMFRLAMATAASFIIGVFVGRMSANDETREQTAGASSVAHQQRDSSFVTVTRIIAM